MILSALEKVKYGKIYTEIYAIIAGETLEEMQQIEHSLLTKGLHLVNQGSVNYCSVLQALLRRFIKSANLTEEFH